MSHQFAYQGGVFKPDAHVSEKFLLFLLAGGQELHFHAAKRDSLVSYCSYEDPKSAVFEDAEMGNVPLAGFKTSLQVGKIFVARSGFNVPRLHYSFYFTFKPEPSPVVTVRVFPGMVSSYYFRGRISFLSKKDALKILDVESPSYHYLKRQDMLPLDTLKQMITVDRSELRKGVRHLRLKRKGVRK